MMSLRESSFFLLIDAQERLVPAIAEAPPLIEAMVRFVKGCRRLGIPILVTEQYPKGLGVTLEPLREALEDAYRPIQKLSFSAAPLPEVKQAAKERTTVFVAGVEAHVCVYQTARDLVEAGLHVQILADAVGSRSLENRGIALERFRQLGAVVSSTEMALFELLETAASPDFKAISAIVK